MIKAYICPLFTVQAKVRQKGGLLLREYRYPLKNWRDPKSSLPSNSPLSSFPCLPRVLWFKNPTGFTGFNACPADRAYLAGMFSPFPGDVKLFDLAFPRIALVAYRVLFSKLGQNHVPFFSFRVA